MRSSKICLICFLSGKSFFDQQFIFPSTKLSFYLFFRKMGFNGIPTFEEYCNWVKDTPLVTNIELKTGVYPYPGIEEKVWAVLQQYHLEDKVIISSFNHESILRMKALAPNLKYGLLTETWLIFATMSSDELKKQHRTNSKICSMLLYITKYYNLTPISELLFGFEIVCHIAAFS